MQYSRCGLPRAEQRGKENLLWPAGHTLLDAPQDATGLLGSQGTLLAHGQPVVHQDTQVPLRRAALQQGRPSLYWCLGLFLPRGRTLHLPLLNLIRFLSAHLSSLSRSRWMAAQPASVSTTPPSLVSSANWLRVHSNRQSVVGWLKRRGTGCCAESFSINCSDSLLQFFLFTDLLQHNSPVPGGQKKKNSEDVQHGNLVTKLWLLPENFPDLRPHPARYAADRTTQRRRSEPRPSRKQR